MMKMWNTSEIWRVFYANKTRLDRLKLTTLGYIMAKLDLKCKRLIFGRFVF